MLLSWGGAPIVADGQGCLHTCIAQNHRMDRLYLNVPFQEKDAAKALGARFDRELKLWYAQSAGEAMTFSKWLPAGIGADALVVPPASLERPCSGSSCGAHCGATAPSCWAGRASSWWRSPEATSNTSPLPSVRPLRGAHLPRHTLMSFPLLPAVL